MREYLQIKLPLPEVVVNANKSNSVQVKKLKDTVYLLSTGQVVLLGRIYLPIEKRDELFTFESWIECNAGEFLSMLDQIGTRTCTGKIVSFIPFIGRSEEKVVCNFDTSKADYYVPEIQVLSDGILKDFQNTYISATIYQEWMRRLSTGDIEYPSPE